MVTAAAKPGVDFWLAGNSSSVNLTLNSKHTSYKVKVHLHDTHTSGINKDFSLCLDTSESNLTLVTLGNPTCVTVTIVNKHGEQGS